MTKDKPLILGEKLPLGTEIIKWCTPKKLRRAKELDAILEWLSGDNIGFPKDYNKETDLSKHVGVRPLRLQDLVDQLKDDGYVYESEQHPTFGYDSSISKYVYIHKRGSRFLEVGGYVDEYFHDIKTRVIAGLIGTFIGYLGANFLKILCYLGEVVKKIHLLMSNYL